MFCTFDEATHPWADFQFQDGRTKIFFLEINQGPKKKHIQTLSSINQETSVSLTPIQRSSSTQRNVNDPAERKQGKLRDLKDRAQGTYTLLYRTPKGSGTASLKFSHQIQVKQGMKIENFWKKISLKRHKVHQLMTRQIGCPISIQWNTVQLIRK